MKSSLMAKLTIFLATLSLAPVAFGGQCPMSCQDNSDSASTMLNKIREDAYEVRDDVDLLESQDFFLTGWQLDSQKPETMRDQINQMDQTLHRLRTIESALPKREDAEINVIAPAVIEPTDTAQDAVVCFNNKLDLWNPQYRAYLGEMFSEANRIVQSTAKS